MNEELADRRFDLCICGFPRWRHPVNEEQRKTIAYTTSPSAQPHHLFMEPEAAPDVVVFRRLPNGRFGKVGS